MRPDLGNRGLDMAPLVTSHRNGIGDRAPTHYRIREARFSVVRESDASPHPKLDSTRA